MATDRTDDRLRTFPEYNAIRSETKTIKEWDNYFFDHSLPTSWHTTKIKTNEKMSIISYMWWTQTRPENANRDLREKHLRTSRQPLYNLLSQTFGADAKSKNPTAYENTRIFIEAYGEANRILANESLATNESSRSYRGSRRTPDDDEDEEDSRRYRSGYDDDRLSENLFTDASRSSRSHSRSAATHSRSAQPRSRPPKKSSNQPPKKTPKKAPPSGKAPPPSGKAPIEKTKKKKGKKPLFPNKASACHYETCKNPRAGPEFQVLQQPVYLGCGRCGMTPERQELYSIAGSTCNCGDHFSLLSTSSSNGIPYHEVDKNLLGERVNEYDDDDVDEEDKDNEVYDLPDQDDVAEILDGPTPPGGLVDVPGNALRTTHRVLKKQPGSYFPKKPIAHTIPYDEVDPNLLGQSLDSDTDSEPEIYDFGQPEALAGFNDDVEGEGEEPVEQPRHTVKTSEDDVSTLGIGIGNLSLGEFGSGTNISLPIPIPVAPNIPVLGSVASFLTDEDQRSKDLSLETVASQSSHRVTFHQGQQARNVTFSDSHSSSKKHSSLHAPNSSQCGACHMINGVPDNYNAFVEEKFDTIEAAVNRFNQSSQHKQLNERILVYIMSPRPGVYRVWKNVGTGKFALGNAARMPDTFNYYDMKHNRYRQTL